MNAFSMLPLKKSQLRLFFEWLLLLVLLLGAGWGFQKHGTFNELDQVAYDGLTWQRAQAADERIVLVEIDDASLAALGRWPWSRAVHAQLLSDIGAASPKGILMDVLFVEPSSFAADHAMGKAAQQIPRLVVPALLTTKDGNILDLSHPEDGIQVQMPIPQLAEHVRIGLATAEPDSDNTVRKMYMGYRVGSEVLPAMAALLLDGRDLGRTDQVLIPYVGGMNHYDRVSYADVLSGNVPASFFHDRYVLIGASAVGLGDLHKTPFGVMSGIEIHANVLDGLLHQRSLSMLEPSAAMLYTLLPLFFLMVGFLLINEKWHLYWLLFLMAAGFGGCAYFLSWQHQWVSPVTVGVLMVVAYVLWSWRRIAAVMRYFDGQLHEIRLQLPASGERTPYQTNTNTLQRVIERIDQLQSNQRQIQVQNRELIDYLSHDLRTPQVSILSAISVHTSHPEQLSLEALLAQITENAQETLRYARDLVELNHAQTGALIYEEHQLQYLVEYAAERIKMQAQGKSIQMDVQANDDMDAWVVVDGELIERALINLMSNAIRYSPEGSTVTIRLQRDDTAPQHWGVVHIADQGGGMSPSLQQALLKGERVDVVSHTIPDAAESMGIGWRMVRSIVQRHQGRLNIKSNPGQGCTISVSLPLVD